MHSESKKADFITYRSLNWSIKRISEKIGVCARTLADWNGQYKDAIANLRYLHADVHFQNLVEARQKDVQLLATRQQALDNELAQRDLGDIPTDKLIRLAILSLEELLAACDHARSLVKDSSPIPDPVPWYVRDRIDRTSKTDDAESLAQSENAEAPNSQENIEPALAPASDTQPGDPAEINPPSTNETAANCAEPDATETASGIAAEQNPPAT